MSETSELGVAARDSRGVNLQSKKPWLIAVCLAGFFVASFGFMAIHHLEHTVYVWDNGATDFLVWYRAAVAIGSPDRTGLYAIELPDGERFTTGFFNPPSMAFLLWPMTKLDIRPAREALLGLSLLAVGGLLLVCWRAGLRGVQFLLACLAMASFWPLYVALQYSHPTPIYALLAAVALIELEAGATASAGGFMGLLALKPSLFAAPWGYLLFKRRWVSFLTSGAIALLLFFGPFLLLGTEALSDYREQSSRLTADAFKYFDNTTSIGAWGVLNWNGYVASLILGPPPVIVVAALSIVTIALTLRVWAKGTLREGWLASMAMTMLILPHLLVYDWLLLFVPAMAVLAERRTPLYAGLLVLLHLAINLSAHVAPFLMPGFTRDDYDNIRSLGGYWAVPALFLLLVYLAFRNEIEARLERQVRGQAAVTCPVAEPEPV